MATYLELQGLFNDNDLNIRVRTAVVIAANDLLSGTPTAADRAFALNVFSNPKSMSEKVLMSVLAENSDATVANIQGASDSAIQANVDTVIPSLVSALAGV